MRVIINHQNVPVMAIECLLPFAPSDSFVNSYSFQLDPKESYWIEVKAKKIGKNIEWYFPINLWKSYFHFCKESNLFTEKELNILKYLFLSDNTIDLVQLANLFWEDLTKEIKFLYQKSSSHYNNLAVYGLQKYNNKFKDAGGPVTKLAKLEEKEYNELKFFYWDYNKDILPSIWKTISGSSLLNSLYLPDDFKQTLVNAIENSRRWRSSDVRVPPEYTNLAKKIEIFDLLDEFVTSVKERLTRALSQKNIIGDFRTIDEYRTTLSAIYNHIDSTPEERQYGRYRDSNGSTVTGYNFSRFATLMSSEDETELCGDYYKRYRDLIMWLPYFTQVKSVLENLDIVKSLDTYEINKDFNIIFTGDTSSSDRHRTTTIQKWNDITLKVTKLSSSLILLSQEPFVYFLSLLRSKAFKDFQTLYWLTKEDVAILFFLVSIIK